MCIDYRQLNAKTKKGPLPRIEDALESLKGAKYFSSRDLAHGYHQVPMAEKDIEKTAFRVGTGGLFEFVKMPFGVCIGPATFMRMMDRIFGEVNFQCVLITWMIFWYLPIHSNRCWNVWIWCLVGLEIFILK